MILKIMKRIFFKQTARLMTVLFFAAMTVSCRDIYDNIKEFSMEEIVYSAHYDTIFGKPGYERVEIDLVKEGRLPSSLIRLGKATKTIIEYDSISLRYDSLFSWINLTGLTQPKLYRFRIYTADDNFEDRSTPLNIDIAPYTSFDREALAVPAPNITTKSDFVVINWNGGLTSDVMEFRGLIYSYADKNGDSITRTKWKEPEFYLTGLEKGKDATVNVRYWVTPKLDREKILDSIYFDQSLTVTLEDSALINFAVSPTRMALVPGMSKIVTPNIEYGLTWTSSNPSVAMVNTLGVVTARTSGTTTITVKSEPVDNPAKIEVTVTDVSAIPAGGRLAGMWTFEDGNDPVKASLGVDLAATGGNFSSIAGPNNTKAVKIGAGSYYAIPHEITANGGGSKVNEYTLMMDIRGTAAEFANGLSIFNNHAGNNGNGVLWINDEGKIGNDDLGGYSSTGLRANTWYRVVIAAKLGESFKVYINSTLAFTASSNTNIDGLMSLLPTNMFYVGHDDNGAGYAAPDFAELRIWNTLLTDEQIRTLGGL
jgi:hypothetical protein